MDRGASESKRTWYSEIRKGEHRCCIPEGWHWRGVAFPACVPRVSTSSRPPYLQLWRRWLTEEGYCCHRCRWIRPATAAHSVQINACSVTLLRRNAMDSSFLSPIPPHPPPPPLPAHSPTFTHSHKHTLSHTRNQNTNGVSSLKTWLCSLMIFFFFFFKWKWGGGWKKMQSPNPWLASFDGLSCHDWCRVTKQPASIKQEHQICQTLQHLSPSCRICFFPFEDSYISYWLQHDNWDCWDTLHIRPQLVLLAIINRSNFVHHLLFISTYSGSRGTAVSDRLRPAGLINFG